MAPTDDPNETEAVTLLVDGDVIAFRAASAVQHALVGDDGFVQPFASTMEGEVCVDNILLGLMDGLRADYLQVYLSDPEANWRKELFADYKSNRKESVRPLLLAHLKDYLRARYGAKHWPALEADDVLGIVATTPSEYPGKRIVVGRDKDFMSIPGLHHQLGETTPSGKPLVKEITRDYADFFHLVQTLSGDRVDGYAGCPGIGMERARRILADPVVLTPERGLITRGPRKGQETVKWSSAPANGNLWGCVVSHYQKAGLKASDALLTARLARILRAEDYNPKDGSITLWVPPNEITLPRAA